MTTTPSSAASAPNTNTTLQLLECELTCSICTDVLFDPITFLNCLHTHCGSCASRWFRRPNAHPPTCPVCRKRVRKTKTNPIVISLLEDFLRNHPHKARPASEQAELRSYWKPGDAVLPVISPLTTTTTLTPTARIPSQRAVRSQPSSPPPPPARTTRAPSVSLSPRPPIRSPSAPPIQNVYNRHRSPSAPVSIAPPSTVIESLSLSISPIHITCDSCTTVLSTSVHLECTLCPHFHLCLRCSRSHPHPHPTTRQKLISQSWPTRTRYLLMGVFCDVCDHWIDPLFWACGTCSTGGWSFCTSCVRRGWCCTHDLTLMTNTSIALHPLRRGGGDSYAAQVFRPPATGCVVCGLGICGGRWLHCFGCEGGCCTTCYYNAHRTWPSPERGRHRFFACPRGCGEMAVLAGGGGDGGVIRHRSVGAHGVRPRPPEWLRVEVSTAEGARRAVAVRGYWPEEEESGGTGTGAGDRKWGFGQWLCFPAGAEIADTVRAFEEPGEGGKRWEWCWGSYCGAGGLFPREFVEFV